MCALSVALAAIQLLCGCATLFFKPFRESRFINMDAEVVHVEYGREKRTQKINGLTFTYDTKVRVTLPDGKRMVLYQALAATGVLYRSKDNKIEFFEKGPYCIIREKGVTRFEGVFCQK